MKTTAEDFPERAREGLANPTLQSSLAKMRRGMPLVRAAARDKLEGFDALREAARALKDDTLAHLDRHLARFADEVEKSGGTVHWCARAEDACAAIVEICRKAGARSVTKGKSMVGEEIALNEALAAAGIEPVETDLGEYIIQLRQEAPSHIIAPAIHVSRSAVAETFRHAHSDLAPDRPLDRVEAMVSEARERLRGRFLAADVGITGANFLIAETGTTVIVTNEGNGDLTQCLPRVHIVLASIEKVVPTFADAANLIRLLARSATGQAISTYVTFSTGPKRAGDRDGPEAFHVVLLDGGRSDLLATEQQAILRCIRCGACLNHCPVYTHVGGHAYGSVYPGPMGAVLTPALAGIAHTQHLPNASTFCGRCEEVCPVKIPLPALMRAWRTEAHAQRLDAPVARSALALWAWLARRPWLYRLGSRLAAGLLAAVAREGRLTRLPLARGFTETRDMPAPEGVPFHVAWANKKRPRP